MSETAEFEPISANLRHAISNLVAHGLVRHNGKYRPDANGVQRPEYERVPDDELTEHARAHLAWMYGVPAVPLDCDLIRIEECGCEIRLDASACPHGNSNPLDQLMKDASKE